MNCPECKRNFEGVSCPRCGAIKGTLKTSTILISAGEDQNVYHSLDDVPDTLKRQLLRSTNGLNSATIVIADREGRREIAKAIRNLPAPENPEMAAARRRRKALLNGVGAILLVMAAALIWFIFRRRT
jgi:hypothetical protein